MNVQILIPVSREIQPNTKAWIKQLLASGLASTALTHVGCAWVDQARANLQDEFVRGTADAAFFVDSDICAPDGADLLAAMISLNAPVVAQTYVKRGTTLLNVVFDEERIGHQTVVTSSKRTERVAYIQETGLGCTLIRRDVFSALAFVSPRHKSLMHGEIISNPYFPEIIGGDYYGDDRVFFHRVRSIGIRPVTLIDRYVTHDGRSARAAELSGVS